MQVVWGQFKAFVEEGWTIHVVFSKSATNILVDACNANGLEVNTFQVSTIGVTQCVFRVVTHQRAYLKGYSMYSYIRCFENFS